MTTSGTAADLPRAAEPAPARHGSLQAVLEAMRAGTTTVDDLASATGLDPGLVRLALDRLVALGRVTSDRGSTSCPASGCGGCALPTGTGAAPVASPRWPSCPTGPADELPATSYGGAVVGRRVRSCGRL